MVAAPASSDTASAALRCRRRIVAMTHRAGAGHPGGSLSAIDLMVCLYGSVLNHRPEDPLWDDRDRFILSKGHASPAMYAVLAEHGYISEEDLEGFRTLGSICQGHVDSKWTPGVDFSGGSLGMGLSFGLGVAMAASLTDSQRATWVMLGDGECQEGQIWEAAMAAIHHEVERVYVIVDRNRIQNDDFVDEQMRLGDLSAKWDSFGWRVIEVDGHDHASVLSAFQEMVSDSSPAVLIARTTKGKGVSFMENNPSFHGAAPSDEQLVTAMEELS